jgi:hypothetical protein
MISGTPVRDALADLLRSFEDRGVRPIRLKLTTAQFAALVKDACAVGSEITILPPDDDRRVTFMGVPIELLDGVMAG